MTSGIARAFGFAALIVTGGIGTASAFELVRGRSIEANWTEDRVFVQNGAEKRNAQTRSLKAYFSSAGRIFDFSERRTQVKQDLHASSSVVYTPGELQKEGREQVRWTVGESTVTREQVLPAFSRVYEIAVSGDTCKASLRLAGTGKPMISSALSGGTIEFRSITLRDGVCKIVKGNVFGKET